MSHDLLKLFHAPRRPNSRHWIGGAVLPLLVAGCIAGLAATAMAQQPGAWERPGQADLPPLQDDASRPPYQPAPSSRAGRQRPNDAYVPPPSSQSAWDPPPGSPPPGYQQGYPQGGYPPSYPQGNAQGYPQGGQLPYQPPYQNDSYRNGPGNQGGYAPPPPSGAGGYGAPYQPPGAYDDAEDVAPPPGRGFDKRPPQAEFSQNEVLDAGHQFFGSISKGLANAIEYVFQQSGRPNGYILGEDAGGAFVAGLRYGEGVLHTKDAGRHRVYWQGPSLGYDFGGEGSKTMVLVYNLRDPSEIYHRFGGVQGSAYLVGGVSVQFQKYGDVVLAPIRSGLGLRLGANVGYLKYTRTPTWNPF